MFRTLKRIFASVVVLVVVTVLLIDTLPSKVLGFYPPAQQRHHELQKGLSPWLFLTGVWQGTWSLFAPEPDRTNSQILATIYYEDGSEKQWNSPEFLTIHPADKFFLHRRMEFYDNIQQYREVGGDFKYKQFSYSGCFIPFVNYLGRKFDKNEQGSPATRVELYAKRSVIPLIEDGGKLMATGGEWWDAETDFLSNVMLEQDYVEELTGWPEEFEEDEIGDGKASRDEQQPEQGSDNE